LLQPSDFDQECQQIVDICQRLYQRNMLAAADGNVSVRVGDNILITPSGVSKGFINKKDICLVSLDNKVLMGQPSSERLMHLQVYNSVPEAKAVVHAHPPFAIAWSVAYPDWKELPANCLSELILATGGIPIAPYARPGGIAMGDALNPYLPQHKVMILSRHGGLSWGDSLTEAWMGMERLEHTAEILYRAQSLKELSFLPEEEVEALKQMRAKIGNKNL
jgi:L-fuculose-phosphate aldolase